MSIIEWVTGKGIQLSEQAIKDFFEIKSPQDILEREVGINQRMLQIQLQSSYGEALRHLRDGRMDLGIEKIVSAIENNELNLPAHVLYCHLLGFEKRYDRALEEAWEILEKFGPGEDLKRLLPEGLVQQFISFYNNTDIECSPFVLSRDQHYLTEIWCLPTGVLCNWRFKPWNAIQIERLWTPKMLIEATTWRGDALFEAPKKSVIGVTNRYALLREATGATAIYRMKDGFLLPSPLYPREIEQVFTIACDGVWKKNALPGKWKLDCSNVTHKMTYKNVILNEERYDRSTFTPPNMLRMDYGCSLHVRRADPC